MLKICCLFTLKDIFADLTQPLETFMTCFVYRFSDTYSNFSQMVWAKTRTVGCAATHFPVPSAPTPNVFRSIIVCNYGPGTIYLFKRYIDIELDLSVFTLNLIRIIICIKHEPAYFIRISIKRTRLV